MCLNYPELVHKHPAHLVSPLTMLLEKFRFGRTTPQGADAIVRGGSSTANFIELEHKAPCTLMCRVLSHKCRLVCWHKTSSPAAVQEIQCVQGGCARVRGGSSTVNLMEPT